MSTMPVQLVVSVSRQLPMDAATGSSAAWAGTAVENSKQTPNLLLPTGN
jgi:hypothetical protein